MTNAATSEGHADPRPEEHGGGDRSPAHTQRSPRRRYRRILSVTGTVLLTILIFAALLVGGALVTGHGLHQAVPADPSDGFTSASGEAATSARNAAGNSAGRHGRLVVAVVAGTSGTVASDLLAPYDVFASSPRFRTYVVAAHTGPVPLEGGPALLPTYSFADVDADRALRPDLVVVPALSKPTGRIESALRGWVSAQHHRGARVLGVCAGALVLADTGMLDGLHATSHWSRIGALQGSRPAVHWVTGRRWVEDGSVTTTAAVSSGVPAALHLVAELAGPAEAQRVADQHPELGWTPRETTAITKDHFAAGDWPVGLNAVEPWFRPTVGIALHQGVDELDATAAFEVYTQSAAARTVAVASGESVRTRHGLVLLTTGISEAPSLSRVVVPGAGHIDARLQRWVHRRHLDMETLGSRGSLDDGRQSGGGFTSALQNLTDHTGATTATSTAKMIGYPTTTVDLHHGHSPVRSVLLVLVGLVVAVLLGTAPASIARRRRRPAADSARTA